MHEITAATMAAMEAQTVESQPQLVLEFDYCQLHAASVSSPDSPDENLFPKESVLHQRYVNSGLPRAIVGQSRVTSQSADVQYRVVDEDDQYKYWVSPTLSTSTSISNAWMEVTYDQPRPTNKVFVAFDVSFAAPTSVDIDIHRDGSWVRIVSGAVPNSKGVIERYALSGGGWSSTRNINHTQTVGAVRVTVNSMNKTGVFAHFLTISTRLVVDVSEKLVEFSINRSMEDVSAMAPIGNVSVNDASIVLEDEDGLLNPENSNSIYYRLLSRNVRAEASVVVNNQSLHQGTFYAESWSYSIPGVEMGMSCSDVTRFMQEMFLSPFVLYNYNLRDAVRDILQRSGFNSDVFMVMNNPVIPYIWYSEKVSVWQALKDLANATLSYFYVNEHGRFTWVDFNTLTARTPTYELDATENLINLSHSFDVMANSVTVLYNKYGVPTDPVTKEPVTQELWSASQGQAEPDGDNLPEMGGTAISAGGDQALLSMPLAQPMTTSSTYIALATDATGMDLWDETGIVNVQGEYIRYSGKNRDARRLTGLSRGLFKSTIKNHTTNNLGVLSASSGAYLGTQTLVAGNLVMTAPSRNSYSDYNYSLFGGSTTEFNIYGTSIMFPVSSTNETAGLIINKTGALDSKQGIYIELMTSTHATKHNMTEVTVYKRSSSGAITTFGAKPYNIARQNWYDVEVAVGDTATNKTFSVYVNGSFVVSFTDGEYEQGRWGAYVRGRTTAEFSRLYASSSTTSSMSSSQFQDVLSGSSFSSDYVFSSEDPNITINEFAPQVRQVKEFTVDYSVFPAKRASLLSTNIWQARTFGFVPGPFGAKFFIENKSDRTAVVHGESPNLFPDPIQMYLIIYGEPIIVKSEKRKVVRDELSILRNGLVELEVSNPWIQTDEMAQNISDAIVSNFGFPMDTVDVGIFPTFALQLGDVVSVDYAERGYSPNTHHYYVLSSSLTWSDGFSQGLTLRRKR